VLSWFGMVCLEVGLDDYLRQSRPAAASVVSRMENPENADMTVLRWTLAQLGVLKGDVIRAVNGIAFQNMIDITNAVSSLMNSEHIIVEVMRDDTLTSLQYAIY
jgi:S1-C subfamily serine protease